jgi:glycosyltransferase involved in cell wall biosynthesis
MTSNLPLISVIMPCFNAEKHVLASIASVFDQTYPNLELIVVNDGSTDNSLKILQSINDDRLYILNQNNAGVCHARNQGIQLANGELIAFLDSDDTWHPECLSKLYQSLLNKKTAVLSYCGWQNVGLSGGQGEPYVPPDYEALDKLALLFENCCWPIHACLTKKKAILDVGGFDSRFQTSEDYLMWLKIAKDHPIVQVPQVLAYYHHHNSTQATQNKSRLAINHLLVQRSFLKDYPDDAKKITHKLRKELMLDLLLQRGFDCYWNRELRHARKIFLMIMKTGHGDLRSWKYMLPSLLPYKLHMYLISRLESK